VGLRMKLRKYNFVDHRDKEEKLSFNVLVGRHLRDITAALGILQILFAGLAFIDRLNPTVLSSVYMVEVLVNDSFWAGAFLITGIVVIIALKFMEFRAISMAITSACFMIWGILVFIKALTAVQPVALSVGLAAFALGVIGYKTCLAWNVLLFKQQFTEADIVKASSLVG